MPKRKKPSARPAAEVARQAANLERRLVRREGQRIATENEPIQSLSFSRKLDWASQHIENFGRTTKSWLGTDAYGFVPHTNAKTGRTVVRAKIRKPPAPELALIIGDAVHALRATLDHLALELAIAFQRPQIVSTQLEETSEFVIIGDADETRGSHRFDRAAGTKLQGINRDARKVIEGMQPYHRKAAYIEDPLWVIHELDRIDKHRRLNLTGYAMGGVGIGGYIGSLHVEKVGHNGPVQDGTEVAAFTALNSNFQMNFVREIALAEPSLWGNPVLAMQTLTRLRDYISNEIVPLLVSYL